MVWDALPEIDAQAAEHFAGCRWGSLIDSCIKKGAEQIRLAAKTSDECGVDIAVALVWLDRSQPGKWS